MLQRQRAWAISLVLVVAVACESQIDAEDKTGDTGRDGADASGGSGGDPDGAATVDADPATRCPEEDGQSGASGPQGAAATPGPSCAGLAPTCGPNGDEDCCASILVPGGTFYRSYDGVSYLDDSNAATVSDFLLDKYEITVGRFRNFVAAYSPDMIPEGAGKNPNDPNDPGWNPEWNYAANGGLPDVDYLTTGIVDALNCGQVLDADDVTWIPTGQQTWTDALGANENKPINCLTWYLAYAFCIWDGGRLPTEAEWNYAAAGGCEQRVHPWSSPPSNAAIDESYTVMHVPCGNLVCAGPERVGSRSLLGNGRWGHADLAGNVEEWILDWYGSYPNPCIDCTNLIPELFYPNPFYGGDPFAFRTSRGGAFGSRTSWPSGSASFRAGPYRLEAHFEGVLYGARCARSP